MPIARQLAGFLAFGLAVGAWSGCKDSSANGGEPQGTASTPTAEVKDVVLPGVDISPMTPRERHEFSSLVTELFAPCPNVPVSVAQCVLEKRPCAPCEQAAKWIARAVRDGASDEQIQRAYKERYDPGAVKTLPLDGSPSKGADAAQVTIVEFADFECPHCRAAVPMIDAVLAAHPGKVRLVYKFVELPMHVHAEPAARAAFAAGMQGKFWEMEHLLFERQEHLEQSDLERYAQILKLDIGKWKSDMDVQATKDRIAQDRKLEEDLKLKGTPTIYVNGRELDIEADESLEERVAAELGVAPAASGAASAGPPAPSNAPSVPLGAPTAKPH
ncbi:MAG TPA: thioredoxin domain-containing protein [Polyangiaceae bacterium]